MLALAVGRAVCAELLVDAAEHVARVRRVLGLDLGVLGGDVAAVDGFAATAGAPKSGPCSHFGVGGGNEVVVVIEVGKVSSIFAVVALAGIGGWLVVRRGFCVDAGLVVSREAVSKIGLACEHVGLFGDFEVGPGVR